METASSRMNFFLNPSLKQKIEFFKVQIKLQHMEELYKAFDVIKNEDVQLYGKMEDVQEQIEIFGSVYQSRIYLSVICSNFM